MRYEIVAEAYRDLEQATARLALIERLAALFRQTPDELLPTMALLCQGQIAPDFAGVELGVAERLAARAIAEVTSGSRRAAIGSRTDLDMRLQAGKDHGRRSGAPMTRDQAFLPVSQSP